MSNVCLDWKWTQCVDNVKDCHSEQHVGTLTFLEFEASFVPTQKRFGVFPKCMKITGTLPFLEFEARTATSSDLHPRKNSETFLRGWEKDSSQAQNDRVECSG